MDIVLVIVVLVFVFVVLVWSFLQSTKADREKRGREFDEKLRKHFMERKPSVCIDVDGCKVMLRDPDKFFKEEWGKTDGSGKPIRGYGEPEERFNGRLAEYNEKQESIKKTAREIASKALNETNERFAKVWEQETGIRRNQGESAFNYMRRVKPIRDKMKINARNN